MRKLSIDEIWDYTKQMWKWIAFQKFCGDERNVIELKRVWLRENEPEFVNIVAACFFCESQKNYGGCGESCPGKQIDSGFNCYATSYNYKHHPGAFYREILRLDAIRTDVVKHVWKHGDVFRSPFLRKKTVIYIVREQRRPVCACFDSFNYCNVEHNADRCVENATFLFNIKDAFSDRGLV